MTAIYAFCRVADDAVDEARDVATGERHLAFWRAELSAACAGRATTPVGQAVQAAMQRFGVPAGMLGDLLDGVATDLAPRPFADEQELHRYCHRVAAAVGLACLPVLGATSAGAREFADALGHALQRTNILRDLRTDAEAGRCYVPQPWLAAAGVAVPWLRGDGPPGAFAPDGPLARVCERIAGDAAGHFARAQAALRSLARAERRALVPARIMGAVYGDLLARLRARGGDVRAARLRVGRGRKLWLALQVVAGVRA
jgi:phytoene synthase